MSGKGNRGFADLVAGEGAVPVRQTRLPPRTGVLAGRENRLAELASGQARDPGPRAGRSGALCGSGRRIIAITPRSNETNCADLIESIRAQGRQEVPAIVRRVRGEEARVRSDLRGAAALDGELAARARDA